MKELISINKNIINQEEVDSVNARELHEFLGVKSEFRNWIKNRISDYGFTQDIDFISVGKNLPNGGKRNEYIISTDMAKELAMVERNQKGKEARQYFIECERIAKKSRKELSHSEILLMSAQRLVDLEREQEAQKQLLDQEHKRANRLENNIRRTITDVEYFTVIGYANLKGIKAGTYHSPSVGRKAKKLSKEQGYSMGSVVDPKYGNIGTYHCDILDEVFGLDAAA